MTSHKIKRFTEMLYRKFQTNDPLAICDLLNIEVSIIPLGTSKGHYIYSNGMCSIFINKNFDFDIRRAICAHELGHALIHTNTNIRFMTECTFFSENIFEREANLFASCFLLFDLDKRACLYNGYSYNEIAIAEGVPIEFVKFKIDYF